MYKNDLPNWAVSFFTSVEVNDKEELVITNPNFSLHGSITHLRWILEEHDVSRTPSGCKLVHTHYRDPIIHKEYKDRLYAIIDKRSIEGFYVENYVREENGIYYAGFEALDGDKQTHSYDRCIFDIEYDRNGTFYAKAVARLKELGIVDQDIERARLNSANRAERLNELIDNIK